MSENTSNTADLLRRIQLSIDGFARGEIVSRWINNSLLMESKATIENLNKTQKKFGNLMHDLMDQRDRWCTEALAWRNGCAGRHGSQSACVDVQKVGEPDPDKISEHQCQHDRFKPGFTLEWLGSTPQLDANTHRFRCKVCRETFDLAIGEAQLSILKSATCPYGQSDCESTRGGVCVCAMPEQKPSSDPTTGNSCPACGVMYAPGARHFSGCPLHPGAAI